MKGEAGSTPHMARRGHTGTMENKQQAEGLRMLVNVNFKSSVRCQKAVKKLRCALQQLGRIEVSRVFNVLPLCTVFY